MEISLAVKYIHPTLEFYKDYIVKDDGQWEYLEWNTTEYTQPTQAELQTAWDSLELDRKANEYKALRKAEYPAWEDFADAWVKNDQVAMDKYRSDCLAVKLKYPKN